MLINTIHFCTKVRITSERKLLEYQISLLSYEKVCKYFHIEQLLIFVSHILFGLHVLSNAELLTNYVYASYSFNIIMYMTVWL